MTDTNGLDILIAWAIFAALLSVLGVLVLVATIGVVVLSKREL